MKKLPVCKNTFMGSHCPIALPANILESVKNGRDWLSANMMLFMKNGDIKNNDIIYFGNGYEEFGIWKFREVWEDQFIDPFLVSKENIVNVIKKNLERDQYVVMDLDSSVIGKAGRHLLHEQLIYGYDDFKKVFFVLYLDATNVTLDNNPHTEVEFPYKKLEESFESMKKYYSNSANFKELYIRKRRFFAPVTIIKPKKIEDRFYLAQTALEKIRVEFEGECCIRKYPKANVQNRMQIESYMGIGILLRLLMIFEWKKDELYNYLSEHKVSLSFMALYENGRLMLQAFNLIKNVFNIEDISYNQAVFEYEKTCESLKQIYYLRIKYLVSQNSSILERIRLQIESVYQKQYTSLKQIYDIGFKHGIAKNSENKV